MMRDYQILQFFKQRRSLSLVVLVLFIWTASTATPLIHIGVIPSSEQEAKIAPYDSVPLVLPSNLTKPQQTSDGLPLCLHHKVPPEEYSDISFQIIECPNHLKKAITYSLIYTQTVTSFL